MTVAFGIILCIVVIALLVERYHSQRIHEAEIKFLMNHAQAKSVPEFIALQQADVPRGNPKGSEERDIIHPIGA